MQEDGKKVLSPVLEIEIRKLLRNYVLLAAAVITIIGGIGAFYFAKYVELAEKEIKIKEIAKINSKIDKMVDVNTEKNQFIHVLCIQ